MSAGLWLLIFDGHDGEEVWHMEESLDTASRLMRETNDVLALRWMTWDQLLDEGLLT